MATPEDWADALAVDTSDDVHVANPTEGVYVFYTEEAEEYIRTDCAVDVPSHR